MKDKGWAFIAGFISGILVTVLIWAIIMVTFFEVAKPGPDNPNDLIQIPITEEQIVEE